MSSNQNLQKMSSGSHAARNVAILVIVVALVVATASLYFIGGFSGGGIGGPNSPFAPKTITVSGIVSTTGSGTSVTEIIFTDTAGTSYSVQVTGGQFSLKLANPDAYSTQIKWVGTYSWQGGTVDVSNPLDLNVGAGGSTSYNETITVPTPDSTVTISGSASTVTFGTSATSIYFTDSYGTIQASQQLAAGGYIVTLPNEMTYEVQIQYSDAFGGGTCLASNSFSVIIPAGSIPSSTPNFSC